MSKPYSQLLTETTCILCGAPLTKDENCNYCGSFYINRETIEDIILQTDYIFKPTRIFQNVSPVTMFGKTIYQQKELILDLKEKDATVIKQIFHTQVIDNIWKKNSISVIYGNKILFIENAVVASISWECNSFFENCTVEIIYDTIKIGDNVC